MMIDNCRTELLSDYIDDELEPVTRREIEEHLVACDECRGVVSELRNVWRRAGALDDRSPRTELWPGIAERIGVKQPSRPVEAVKRIGWSRRVTVSIPQLLAASIATVALVGTAGWFGARLNAPVGDVAIGVGSETPADVATAVSVTVATRYDNAVAELMTTLEREREWLNPNTVRVVEENLRIIDDAIARAREALMQDPESEYVRDHLERTVRQKLGLLRRVTEMASRS